MDLQGQRDLLLLSELDRDGGATQRTLASKLGVALGLTNLYLKRLARKGYIKISTIPRNRIRYLLTPQGFAEKSRLTYQYMQYSLTYYRDMRGRLKDMLSSLEGTQGQRVAICGTGEPLALCKPMVSKLSFTIIGTQCSGPVSPPCANRRSSSSASLAASGLVMMMAFAVPHWRDARKSEEAIFELYMDAMGMLS